MELSARLGRVMRRLRAERGWSQETLADIANLDRTYVSSLERGMNRATLEVVGVLARAFDLSVLQLIEQVEQEPKAKPAQRAPR
nr:helix-turn-helix transcriptional regulator [Deinococcus pimensis]